MSGSRSSAVARIARRGSRPGAPVDAWGFVAAGSNIEPERHLRLALAELQELRAAGRHSRRPIATRRSVSMVTISRINLVVRLRDERGICLAYARRLQEDRSGMRASARRRRSGRRALWTSTSCCSAMRCRNEPGLVLPRPDPLAPHIHAEAADGHRAGSPLSTAGKTNSAELWAEFPGKDHELTMAALRAPPEGRSRCPRIHAARSMLGFRPAG